MVSWAYSKVSNKTIKASGSTNLSDYASKYTPTGQSKTTSSTTSSTSSSGSSGGSSSTSSISRNNTTDASGRYNPYTTGSANFKKTEAFNLDPSQPDYKKTNYAPGVTPKVSVVPVSSGGILRSSGGSSGNSYLKIPEESKIASAVASDISRGGISSSGSGGQASVMTVDQVIAEGNRVTAATMKARDSGAFDNLKTPEKPTGYYSGTVRSGGGLFGGILGQEQEIMVDRATNQKYLVDRTKSGSTITRKKLEESGADYGTFLTPFESASNWGINYGSNDKGTNTINLSTGKKVTPAQAEALKFRKQDLIIQEKSFGLVSGLALGGGGTKAVSSVTGKPLVEAAKLTTGQVVRNLGIAAGLYGVSPFLPEGARQGAIATNPDLKGVNFEDDKLRTIVQDAYNKTNKKVYGGTTRFVNEQGALVKEETTKPITNLAQTTAYSLFPPLRAVEGGDNLPYAREYKKYITPKLKAAGYTQKQIDGIINVELTAAQTGAGVGLVTTEIASEIGFRTIAKQTIPGALKGSKPGLKQGLKLGGILAVESFPFGVAEGYVGLETIKASERATSTTEEKIQAGLMGGVMASTFNAVGGVATGTFGRLGGKGTQYVGWALDFPGEPIGDKAVDFLSRGTLDIGIPGGIRTTTLSAPSTTTTTVTNPTTTKTTSDTKTSSKTSTDTKVVTKADITTKVEDGIKITGISSVFTDTSIVSPTVNPNSIIIKPSGTNTNTGTSSNTDTDTDTNPNDNTDTDATTEEDAITEEETTTETNTTINSPTNTNVPIVTPVGFGLPPFLPFGSMQPSKLRGKRLKYYDELSQAEKQFKKLSGFRK